MKNNIAFRKILQDAKDLKWVELPRIFQWKYEIKLIKPLYFKNEMKNKFTENYVFCSAIQAIYRIVLVYSVSEMF